MSIRLKHLYQHLIEHRKHKVVGWHEAYKAFHTEVSAIRHRIKEKKEPLSPESDEAFLKKLLYEKSNGIASRGQSVLSHDHFSEFIEDKSFMAALEKFISDPSHTHFKAFEQVWKEQGKSNNPVLIHRVAAACTLEVSTTVDVSKFNQVFSWLEHEKLIPHCPDGSKSDWFLKNQHLIKTFHEIFKDELKTNKTDKYYLSQFVWALFENLATPFKLKKQIIKYGAPGTGKTYQARQQTQLFFDLWKDEFAPKSKLSYDTQTELVQFHPSFSYEDFIEGLRPILDDKGTAQLTLQNGIFKEFCRSAGQWEVDVHDLGITKPWASLSIKDLKSYRAQLSAPYWEQVFAISESDKRLSDAIPPFFFIIDEINRAELSRVFGELMYCLEYRGVEGKIKTQYVNLNNDQTGMLKTHRGYEFFIPHNVYMIGTMNTIDRSVESFDFALRRRFSWQEVKPDTDILKYHWNQNHKEWSALASQLHRLNQAITQEPLLGSDYQIGHAYLMNLNYAKSLTLKEVSEQLWDDALHPLLQEYLRGTGRESELIQTFAKAFGLRS